MPIMFPGLGYQSLLVGNLVPDLSVMVSPPNRWVRAPPRRGGAGLSSRPVLLIWGEGDRMIPAAHVEAARAELPHSQVAILPRSGHFPHLDEPDAFAAVLAAFVRTPGRTAGDLTAPAPRPVAG